MRRGFVDGRWVVAFLIVVPIAVAIGASLIPRLGPHELMSHQVNRLLKDHLPQPVEWERLDVSLDPPRLTVQGVTAGVATNGEPLFRAKTVSLEVNPEPLRRGIVQLREVVVDEMVLRLEWSGEEWRWLEERGRELPEPGVAGLETGSAGTATPSTEPESLPILKIKRSRVWVVDAGVAPAREFELSAVEAEAWSQEDGTSISSTGNLLGGSFRGRGSSSEPDGFTVNLDVKDIDLAPLGLYAPPVVRSSGRVSGNVKFGGTGPSGWRVDTDLQIREADLKIKTLDLKGQVELQATAQPTKQGDVDGEFRIGASNAALDMGGIYQKPPGKSAEVSGEFRIKPDRHLEIGSFRLSIGGSGEVRP